MRLVFAGTPPFAARILAALLDAGHDVAAVYTQPDRPAGRGRRARASAVKSLAETHGLTVLQPPSLRDPHAVEQLRALEPAVMAVAAYGLILPAPVLEAPASGCLNVHASLLPRWRGAAPIQRAILAGDRETGVCIMRMERGLDTGAVLAERRTPIHDTDTAGTLHDRLAALGAEALIDVLARLPQALAGAAPQDDALACYAPRIEKSETRLDWTLGADDVARRVRAFSPRPGAWAELPGDGQRLRVLGATAVNGEPGAPPGSVLRAQDRDLVVACGEGAVRLLEVQPAGGRPMEAGAFLNAGRVSAGDRLR